VQIVTRRGTKTVVVLPYEEYERMIKPDAGLVQFLMASPLPGSDLVIERDPSPPRELELEA
jgi:hypothetical protein